MPSVDILNAVDSVGIIKQQKRKLFAMAKQQGVHFPMQTFNQSKALYSINKEIGGDQIAALEKSTLSIPDVDLLNW